MIEMNSFAVFWSSHVISCMLKYLSHLSSQFSSAHSWLHPSFGQTSHVMSAQKSVDSASVLSVLAASVVFVEFTGEAFVLVVVTRRGTKQQYSASIIWNMVEKSTYTGFLATTRVMLHWNGNMKLDWKWPFSRSKELVKEIFLYRHFFFQTAVTSKRKKIQYLPIAQNYHEIGGFHSLFHESDLGPPFHPLSASFVKESIF